MPNIKSAKKKVRKDRKRTVRNKAQRKLLGKTLKSIGKQTPDMATIGKAYAIIDKAAKRKLIHKKKAARLKSKISKLAT